MLLPLLDTNVILRHLLGDDSIQSPRATTLLMQVEQGSLRVRTTDIVVFETVFTLERRYRLTKKDIAAAVLPLLRLRGIVLPGKRHYEEVFELYINLDLPFADAYHAALVKRAGERQVISFDRHFDQIPGIERIEP